MNESLKKFWLDIASRVLVAIIVAAVLALPFKLVAEWVLDKFKPQYEVPIGTVVAYWGATADIPAGYELCNGDLVTTPNSSILGKRKPDLQDVFVKGAVSEIQDVRQKPETGGSHTISLHHTHTAGDLFALITQKRVSSGFDIPHVSRGTFTPSNGGWGLGGKTAGATTSGAWSGLEDAQPTGTAVEGNTGSATIEFDNRPKFVSLLYIIRTR